MKDINLKTEIEKILKTELEGYTRRDLLKLILNCIDLTTLEGSDNRAKINELCSTAQGFSGQGNDIPNVAAVCVYPVFVKQAKENLKGSGISIASVAGAFPASQTPLHIKLEEVKFAVGEGADEIDMVISRGKFLEGNYQEVQDEITAIKAVCSGALLKVILETGELQTHENIRKASEIAIAAGADFIKTSTGKIAVSATPEAAFIMCSVIREHYEKTGIKIGFKPAGGISDVETAIHFLKIVNAILGKDWLNNQLFRFGASRLAGKVLDELLGNKSPAENTQGIY